MSTLQPISYPHLRLGIFFTSYYNECMYNAFEKRKCVVCYTNYAKPYKFLTCENLACAQKYKSYLRQKNTMYDRYVASEMLKNVNKELSALNTKVNNMRRLKTALKRFLIIEKRILRRK